MAAQDFAVKHARQKDVVGKLRLAGALGARIDFAKGLADYVEFLVAVHDKYEPQISADAHGSETNKVSRKISFLFSAPLLSAFIRGYFLFQSVNRFTRQLHLFTAHSRRRQLNRLVNFDVAGAAAQVSGQGFFDLIA